MNPLFECIWTRRFVFRDTFLIDRLIWEGVLFGKVSAVFSFFPQDNINYLQDKGFHVSAKTRSNYSMTLTSLASSLNMKYIDDLTERVGENSSDRNEPYQMIKNNRVMNFLKSKGYRTIHFSSGWGATDANRYADLEVHCGRGREFIMRMLNALYLPGKEGGLYDSISPVNTFRVVFNAYFDADYDLLKGESYYSTYERPYKFTNVTDRVKFN